MNMNKPMWQTSQQQWAKDQRDANARNLIIEARRQARNMSPEQRIDAAAQLAQRISNQGGGLGIAPGYNFEMDRQVARESFAQQQDLARKREMDKLGSQEQKERMELAREQRGLQRDMLKKARKNMLGGIGSSLSAGGQYRISGI